MRTYQGIAREKGKSIAVETARAADLDGKLSLDQKRFRQVLGNLLDNAVKYSITNTTIRVDAAKVRNEAEIRVSNYSELRISDRDRERIFEYGERGEESSRFNAPGTGIGLAVARDITEMHGGTIVVEESRRSGLGWQNTFLIRLPLSTE
ncbi:MAG: ATP-binding protein [Chloroflexi bacterium]|nr:ATP-binding protein [Chloroflexota bacterium]